MKKDMKKLVSIVLTGIMCISLAGCAGNQEAKNPNPGGDSTEVTIKIMSWLADPVQSGIEKMNQEFMEEHPGVTIEYEAVTGDDYRTVLQTRFASGDGPDIFMNAGYSWLDTFQQYMSPITDEEWAQYLPETAMGGGWGVLWISDKPSKYQLRL